ncbi:MAG: hypothetical protein EOO93_23815, partial [Pedobacter sp.]
ISWLQSSTNTKPPFFTKNDYKLGGTFSDGKGQPSQASAVSHGSPTTRFNGVSVINTGRKI